MKYLTVSLVLSLAIPVIGWAQEIQPIAADGQIVQEAPLQEAPPLETSPPRRFPIDVAGYVTARYLSDDALLERRFYRDYSASLFLSKTLGRWRFHSEFNADTAPEFDLDGIHLFPPRPSLSVKLDSGFVNYNARDWLQLQAGFIFIPTYWRTHRYQSTTLTADDPLIDQIVFPAALKGAAVYGDRYWGDGGVSYVVYGGIDQQSEYQGSTDVVRIERAKVIGGKLTFHMPSAQFFRTFDIAFHRLHRVAPDGLPDELYAVELQLRKNRLEVLGEFEHASLDFVNGVRSYIRQGYYIQPSYRLNPRLFAVARYDQLDRDSLYADQSHLARQSLGLTYRPIPGVSLKVEADRFEPEGGRAPAYYGATAAAVWFFHLP
jgi:hypothetical protein